MTRMLAVLGASIISAGDESVELTTPLILPATLCKKHIVLCLCWVGSSRIPGVIGSSFCDRNSYLGQVTCPSVPEKWGSSENIILTRT